MQESLFTGGVCNGRGDIVNITTQGIDVACSCFPRFSGGSDFFDTRFAVPGHGENLSLTCSSSMVGEAVVWGLVLLGVFFRFIQVGKIWLEKRHLFTQRNPEHPNGTKSRTREFRAEMRNFAIALLTFDLVVLSPITVAASALKISGQVMGTDVAVTLMYVFIPIFFQLENSLLANEEFTAITRFVPREERMRISKLRNRLEAVSWISYMLGALAPTMTALALDKSLGPLENNEYVTILVRNLFIVLWSSFASVANYVVLTRFEHLLGSGVHSSSLAAVEHMRNANKRLVRMYVLISLVYLVFCIPQLWAFQTYCYGLIVFVGTFRHPAKAFKSMHTLSSSKEGTDSKTANNKLSPLTTNNNDQVMSDQQSIVMPRVSDMGSLIVQNMKSASHLKSTELRTSIRDL